MHVTRSQIAAGLALLDMSQAELAENTGISKPTISNLLKPSIGWETKSSTRNKIISFLESRGIEFTEHEGVKKSPSILTLRGREGFRYFMEDVYDVSKTVGGEMCIHNARPANWLKWLGEDWYDMHKERMLEAYKEKKFRYRISVQKHDYTFIAKAYAEYRWVPDEIFNQQSVYVYGDRLALMCFSETSAEIFVLRKQEFAESFMAIFDLMWNSVTEIPDCDDYKPKI